MTTVDNVIARQNEFFGLISRSVENLNKLGPAKTTRGAVESCIGALKTNWEIFHSQHEKLFAARTSEMAKLPYFADNLYATCEEKYLDAVGVMLDVLETLKPDVERNPAAVAPPAPNASQSSRPAAEQTSCPPTPGRPRAERRKTTRKRRLS